MSIVFLDKDGIMVDSEGEYLRRNIQFMKIYGLDINDKDLNDLAGSNPKRDREIYKKWFGPNFDVDKFMKEKFHYFDGNPVDFVALKMAHLNELLDGLRMKNCHITLVSSSLKRNIDRLLSDYGIRDYFEHIVSGEDFKESKPNPEIYNYAKSLYAGVDEPIFVVEDSTLGIEAAKGAGLTTIAKRDERFGYDQSKADFIIDDLLETLDIVS